MNKYELAVVVSAKIEDEERAAVVDRCKALIERFGGTILSSLMPRAQHPSKSKTVFVLWTT